MKNIRLSESELTNIIKRVVSENLSSPSQNLRGAINDLLDREFANIDPSEAAHVFEYFAKAMRADEYRKKHNIGSVSREEILRNFRKK